MKICFLAHNLKHDNGAGVFSRTIIERLKERLNAEAVIFVTESSGHQDEILLGRGIVGFVRSFLRIRRECRDSDVIHALDAYPYGVIAVLCAFGLSKKLFITAAGTGAINHLYRFGYSTMLKMSYRRADEVVAISNFTKQEILKKVPDLPITVINHGVEDSFFNKITDPDILRDVSGLKPYILSVGSLRYRKGYRWSIRSFARISKTFPDIRYVIVGKVYAQSELDKLKNIAGEEGVSDKVIFLTDVDNDKKIRALYQNAELFFLMSQNDGHDVEGFGLVFLEAAASGLPVIGSSGCGVEDAMLPGENGYLISPKDVEGCAGLLIKLLADDSLRRRFSEKSISFAEHSTWEERAKEYSDLFEKHLPVEKGK